MEESGQIHAPAALPPRNKLPLFIIYEAASTSEPVWTLFRCLLPWCELNYNFSAIQPVASPLYRLSSGVEGCNRAAKGFKTVIYGSSLHGNFFSPHHLLFIGANSQFRSNTSLIFFFSLNSEREALSCTQNKGHNCEESSVWWDIKSFSQIEVYRRFGYHTFSIIAVEGP
jgi:hypothetical protein